MAKTLKGIVKKSDLSGGVWTFATDGGENYQITGGDKGLYVDGQRVSIQGDVDEEMMGIGMMGDGVFKVKSWKKA